LDDGCFGQACLTSFLKIGNIVCAIDITRNWLANVYAKIKLKRWDL
jgi:hypothetical protein